MNGNILYTTYAICNSHELSQETINEMVSWGIASPCGIKTEKWLFTQNDFDRIGRALRFKDELDINIPGAALALDLLEEIQNLRNKEN
ncbi:MAG: chaperone modulator CbpM [Gammaproteobacteria bacterium]